MQFLSTYSQLFVQVPCLISEIKAAAWFPHQDPMKGFIFPFARVSAVTHSCLASSTFPWQCSLLHPAQCWSRAQSGSIPAWGRSWAGSLCHWGLTPSKSRGKTAAVCLHRLIICSALTHRHNVNVREAHFCLVSSLIYSALFLGYLRATPTCNLYMYITVDMSERFLIKRGWSLLQEVTSSCMHTQTHPDPLMSFNFSKEILLEKGEAQTKTQQQRGWMYTRALLVSSDPRGHVFLWKRHVNKLSLIAQPLWYKCLPSSSCKVAHIDGDYLAWQLWASAYSYRKSGVSLLLHPNIPGRELRQPDLPPSHQHSTLDLQAFVFL